MTACGALQLDFLLVSDIHFGDFSFTSDFAFPDKPPRNPVENTPSVKSDLVEKMHDKQLEAMLVAGDMTSNGQPSEVRECSRVLLDVSDGLGVPRDSAYFVFGNHDLDWQVSGLASPKRPRLGYRPDELYQVVAGHIGQIFVHRAPHTVAGPVPGCALYEREKYL